MKLLNRLRSWHYSRKADRLQRRAKQLHAEMYEKMGPYMSRITELEKQAYTARKMASVTSIDSLRDVIAKGKCEAFGATLV